MIFEQGAYTETHLGGPGLAGVLFLLDNDPDLVQITGSYITRCTSWSWRLIS